MNIKRIWQTVRLHMIKSSSGRTEYLRRQHIFGAIGENCTIQKRKVPLYANLIKMGNNVHIASNVSFLTHDVTHLVLNHLPEVQARGKIQEKIGCIEIGDNVFIGSGTHILYDTKIGSNVIIGTSSVVTHDIPDNSIAAGVPARVIGSFSDYVEKALNAEKYPERLKPKNQTVSVELAKTMWERFDREHS